MRRPAWVCLSIGIGLAACGGGGGGGGQEIIVADHGTDPGPPDPGAGESSGDVPVAETPAEDVSATDVIPPDVPGDPGPADPGLPPKICHAASSWTGQQAFTDVTKEAGLAGVTGARLGSVDFDGDGRPDLAVRYYAQARDDFAAGGARYTFLLRNKGDGTFEDVTLASGFTRTRDGKDGRIVHAVAWADVDNDGDLDAFTGVSMDPDPAKPDAGDRNEILLNQGDGTFALGPGGDLRHADKRLPNMGASFSDTDRDGKIDLWLPYGMGVDQPEPDRLYRGDGAGSFADVTTASGLMTKGWLSMKDVNAALVHRNSWGSTACDLNDDGWPDLLVSVYGRYFNALYLGGPSGFKDVSVPSGFASDDRTDWTTNLNAQCYCKLKPTAEGCTGVPAPPAYFSCTSVDKLRWSHEYDRQPWRLGGNTFTTACADMDNDGDLDLVNDEIVHWDVGPTSDPTELLINDGAAEPHFGRPGNENTGLARTWAGLDWNAGDMTGALFDFDNDGRKDVFIGSSDYPGTRAFLFHQKADGKFEEVKPETGIQHPRSHGVAVADFDGDGDLDVALGHGLARCSGDPSCHKTAEVHLFRNDVGQDGNRLRIALVGGPGSNRAAIGARVTVVAGGVTQVQEVGGGYGHLAIQHELVQHFGLGPACEVDKLEVRWPDAAGTKEVFTAVQANYVVRIVQGAGKVEYLGL